MSNRIEELVTATDAWCDQNFPPDWTDRVDEFLPLWNEKFAALVAAAEREACAKIADSQINNTAILLVNPGKSAAAWDIANAIRARGSK
jgi:ethanolamine utilization microcompartment shell protein EutS